jgi:hypothetical protein
MTIVEKLRDALGDLQDSYRSVEYILDQMDAEDDDDPEPAVTRLSPKVQWEVAQALGRPEWTVSHDAETAVLELCEKVTGVKR